MERYEKLVQSIKEKQRAMFLEWAAVVPSSVQSGLNMSLLRRDQATLILNFDPALFAVLKEVKYLKQMYYEDLPKEALAVSDLLSKIIFLKKFQQIK